MVAVELGATKVVGDWRAGTDVGTESGECKIDDREEEARVPTGLPMGVDVGKEFWEIEPAAQ